ncbi:hypothetical protein BX661DRAFT_2761 [Kickxella alabastrina]|uniref:uncharacterized protein n=1 Tax=Kickxella alabastrina TaxID=61397 RepID=UPI00221E821D|nr:uncharacterized protein BX661DRAFT_2761 [Kickxella alabastrina]KAI7834651.1 hypothetical protein BX661DRAFT_2761 [Kickxella alabastrina]
MKTICPRLERDHTNTSCHISFQMHFAKRYSSGGGVYTAATINPPSCCFLCTFSNYNLAFINWQQRKKEQPRAQAWPRCNKYRRRRRLHLLTDNKNKDIYNNSFSHHRPFVTTILFCSSTTVAAGYISLCSVACSATPLILPLQARELPACCKVKYCVVSVPRYPRVPSSNHTFLFFLPFIFFVFPPPTSHVGKRPVFILNFALYTPHCFSLARGSLI